MHPKNGHFQKGKWKKSLDYCGFVVGLWSVAGFESEKEFGLLLGLCYLWLIGLLIVLHSLQPMHHRMLYGLWSYPSCQFYMKIREKKKLKKEEENNYVWWCVVNTSKCALGSFFFFFWLKNLFVFLLKN